MSVQDAADRIKACLRDGKSFVNRQEAAEHFNSAQKDISSSKNEDGIHEDILDNRNNMDREEHNGMLLDAGIKKISWSRLIIWSILIRMVRYWFLR